MKRRQTKKELKKALANVQKPQHKEPPTLQEAWNVVAAHLEQDGEVCYFIDREYRPLRYNLHTAHNRSVVVSNL